METISQNKSRTTWKPTVGGILSIIAGTFAFITGLVAIHRAEVVARIIWHPRWEIVAVLSLVLGIVAIIGGIFALRRRVWGLALAGAICALFPPHVSVLGILAIIFVTLSRSEFDQSAPKVVTGTASGTETKASSTPPETTPPDKGSST